MTQTWKFLLAKVPRTEARYRYCIAFTARSGSTWLESLLSKTQGLGLPQEWFNPVAAGRTFQRSGCVDLPAYYSYLKRVMARRDVFGLEMTWPQARQRFREVDVALLPVGSIEQHGPHLPLDTDAFDADYLARSVADNCTAPKPTVLPLIPYGVSYHHNEFSGTISIDNNTLSRLVYEIGMSAAAPRPSRNDQPRMRTVTFGATVAVSVPAPNTTRAMVYNRLEPTMSPSRPAPTISAAMTSEYNATADCTADVVVLRSFTMSGMATFSIVVSNAMMNITIAIGTSGRQPAASPT